MKGVVRFTDMANKMARARAHAAGTLKGGLGRSTQHREQTIRDVTGDILKQAQERLRKRGKK